MIVSPYNAAALKGLGATGKRRSEALIRFVGRRGGRPVTSRIRPVMVQVCPPVSV